MARNAIAGLSNLPLAGNYGAGVDINSVSGNVRVALPNIASATNIVEVYGFDDPVSAGSGVPPQGNLICRLTSNDFSFQIGDEELPGYLVFCRTAGTDTIAPIIVGETSTARGFINGIPNLATAGNYTASIDITPLSDSVRVSIPDTSSTANIIELYGFDNPVSAGAGTPIGGNFIGRLFNGSFSLKLNTKDLPSYIVFYRVAGTDIIAPVIAGNPRYDATSLLLSVRLAGIAKSTFTTTKTSAFSMLIHTIVKYDPTGGTFVLTLPSAIGLTPDESVMTVNISTSTTTVTVATVSGQTILGNGGVAATTYTMSQAGQWCTFISDGTNWLVAPGQ